MIARRRGEARAVTQELPWLVPFVCLGLAALALFRPWHAPASTQNRVVVDAAGRKVALPDHVRIVPYLPEYLPKTHAPGLLYRAGTPRDQARFAASLYGRIYPQLAEGGRLWASDGRLGFGNLETEIAWPADVVTLGFDNPVRRRLGLPHVTTWTGDMDRDAGIFSQIRIGGAVIGQSKEESETRIARYKQAFAALDQEMRPETITSWPSLMSLGASAHDWSRIFFSGGGGDQDQARRRAGVGDAVGRRHALGRQQDAERVLALDPDIILLLGSGPQEFFRDPRWRGLKAVRTRRVYANNSAFSGYRHDLDNLPYSARWGAEIAHPERLQPKVRELLRAHYLEAYGYHLSDKEIDDMLSVNLNRGSAGYKRFTADYSEATAR